MCQSVKINKMTAQSNFCHNLVASLFSCRYATLGRSRLKINWIRARNSITRIAILQLMFTCWKLVQTNNFRLMEMTWTVITCNNFSLTKLSTKLSYKTLALNILTKPKQAWLFPINSITRWLLCSQLFLARSMQLRMQACPQLMALSSFSGLTTAVNWYSSWLAERQAGVLWDLPKLQMEKTWSITI